MSKPSNTRSQNDSTQGNRTDQVDLEKQGGTDEQNESPSPQGGESSRTPSRRKSASIDSSVTPVTKKIETDEALSHAEGLKRFKELDRRIVSGLRLIWSWSPVAWMV